MQKSKLPGGAFVPSVLFTALFCSATVWCARPAAKTATHASPQAAATDHDHDAMQMDHDHGDMDMSHDHAVVGGAEHAHSAHTHSAMTPSGPLVRFLLLISMVFAGGLMWRARSAASRAEPSTIAPPVNLLELPVIGGVLRSRYFFPVLILPVTAVFLLIVLFGLLGKQETGNPAILLTWILWWPAVVFTFIVAGRVWCAVCPFGYMGKLLQKLYSLRWKVPAVLRNMWLRLALFLALTWLTTLFALDRSPLATAWLGLGLAIGAIALAVLFEKRAFCRYICPVGGIFGLYAMTAPLRLAVKDKAVCRSGCAGKNCYGSCDWFEYPPAMQRGAECSLCLDCVRACPKDNIALRTQSVGADLARLERPGRSLDEATTIAAVLGIAVLQTAVMLHGWSTWEAIAGAWLGLPVGSVLYTFLYVLLGVFMPLLLLALVSGVSHAQAQRPGGLKSAVRTSAYCFLPLGLALHAAHNFHHLFGEGAAIWPGLRNAAARVLSRPMAAAAHPASIPPDLLFVLQWLTLIGGLYLAYRVAIARMRRYALGPQRAFRAVLPILLFGAAYTLMNIMILAAPMAHRH